MLGERIFCFPGMAVRSKIILLWFCIYIWLQTQVQGALVISHRDALTEETKNDKSIHSIKKRHTDFANMVEVFSMKVDCSVMYRFAHTVISYKALNKANSSQEIFFEVELPKTAFISNFSMTIEGIEYVGEVKEKEKAKKEYEKAVSSGKTAGLVKASGRKMEKFSVSVNIEAEGSVVFILTYEELLKRKMGQYEILTRVRLEQPVQDFQFLADIYEPQGIAFVEATFLTNDLLSRLEKTVTDTKAHFSFSPSLEKQRKCPGCEGTIIDGDFIIKYDVKRGESLGEIQIVNGYFVHFFAPPDLPGVPKNVVFVIDRSGSMSGIKIKQTREALEAILKDLNEEDHFAVILFDNKIVTWRDSLTKATTQNVSKAITYVRKIKDNGATNINDALLKAVSMLVKQRDNGSLPERSVDMIILLTDGMPNNGESRLPVIQQNVRQAIGGKMSLFSLGFGKNVDYSFLDVMSRENKGLARRIFEGSDATLQLQGFYDEVSRPLLFDVDMRYPDNSVESLTKNHYTQLFNGSEIVVSGKLTNKDPENVLVEVFAKGPEKDFRVNGKAHVVNLDVTFPEKEYIFGDFSERLWAYLTIQQLLENSDIGTQKEKDNRAAKALDMSLRYSFVTPVTSLVVNKPETKEGSGSPLIADKLTEVQRQKEERRTGFSRSSSTSSRHKPKIQPTARNAKHPLVLHRPAGSHRARASSTHSRSNVDGDPHFMIELPERGDALCFSINDKPGTIFNLVRDPQSGFVVNGQIIGKKRIHPDANVNTYFGRLGVSHQKLGLRLEVSTQDILVFHDGKKVQLLWSDAASITEENIDLRLANNCSLTVTLRHSVKFVVIRHTKVWRRYRHHQDYLGFYTLDSQHLSSSTHGLLGEFYHGVEFEVTRLDPGEVQKNFHATLYVKGQTLNVTRHWQKDFSSHLKNGENIPCWFVENNGTGLIDGRASDYIVSGLYSMDS